MEKISFLKGEVVTRIGLNVEETKQEAEWKMKNRFPVHMCYKWSERGGWLYSYTDMDGNKEIILLIITAPEEAMKKQESEN